MDDPLLATAAAAASHPGAELFDQNIVHAADRINIPNQPVPLKPPIQEPPPPYAQLPQSLPQPDVHPPATLSQPTAEVPQIQAQAPPQPVQQPQQLPQLNDVPDEEPPQPMQDWPGRLQDPLFKCLLTQDQNTGDCCSISIAKIYLCLNRHYAREMKLICAPSGLVNRLSNLANSPILQRAFISGWAMLATFAFPLIPSHVLRCIWVVGQFVFSLSSLILSCLIIKYNCDSVWSWAQFASTVTAFLLAALDMVSCLYVAFKKRRQTEVQEGERQLLIGNEQTQSSRLAMWLWRYNDLLRLITTEVVGYVIVVTSLINVGTNFTWVSIISCNGTEEGHGVNLRLVLLTISSFGFCVFAYMVQFAVICRLLYMRWWMRPKSSESCKGACLIINLLLIYIGYRTMHILGFAAVAAGLANDQVLPLRVVGPSIFFIPALYIITYFIRSHGEIVDFCIAYCTAYLRELDHISKKPGTSQDTMNVIHTLLRQYEFEDLQVSSIPYFSQTNLCGNFYLTSTSPLVNVLSFPSLAAVVIYLFGIATGGAQLSIYFLAGLVVCGVINPFIRFTVVLSICTVTFPLYLVLTCR